MTDPNRLIDTTRPHPARMYDFGLGGKDNYAVDREAVEQIEREYPGARKAARLNRAFMHRAVAFVAQVGIGQFFDLGTGIPTEPNLHQVVQALNPGARVVYVDNDPVVLSHARALLTGTEEGHIAYIDADVREPGAILAAPELRETLDLSKPVALSLIALAHFISGETAYDIVNAILDRLPSGSYLIMSHLTADFDPEAVAATTEVYHKSGLDFQARSEDEFARFFSGLELVPPGIVQAHRWPTLASVTAHMDRIEPWKWEEDVSVYVAVARKP